MKLLRLALALFGAAVGAVVIAYTLTGVGDNSYAGDED